MYGASLNGLVHPIELFSKDYIRKTAEKYGFYRNYILERHMWSYEMLGEIQKLTKDRCILKGGACTQAYLPLPVQRCTADIDFVCNLSNNEIIEILKSVCRNLTYNKIKCSFKEYIPAKGKTLPMVTYMLDLPFYYNPKKRKSNFLLKFDFLFMDTNEIPVNSTKNTETFGMKLNFSPLCISPATLISDKLLTFAINSIGLQIFKLDGFYKNIYDLYYLLNTFKDEDIFSSVSSQLKISLYSELTIKKLPMIPLNKILTDVLKTLWYFSIIDLSYQGSKPPENLRNFEKLYLQQNISNNLDSNMWSIMSMHLYLWATSLKNYIQNGDLSKLQNLKSIEGEYRYFLSLNSKNKDRYIRNLKKILNSKNKKVNLSKINHPLRLIYTNYLM
ncbi:nucleotidyl transferase AbiEii/AbiGii toxin family protein [Clostridium sp. KNHs214]|uniref:nucleotidyl transferase AbiEii/AbiGii toxin family protein n=1 Tax=Clostridium sp. KNHs214 TaxID=1540257 RepID=UPI000554CD37|nr:nucleotidyl transferase AbiEii/AbiGii toxin family protein [Clostridium sp. KNHs214]